MCIITNDKSSFFSWLGDNHKNESILYGFISYMLKILKILKILQILTQDATDATDATDNTKNVVYSTTDAVYTNTTATFTATPTATPTSLAFANDAAQPVSTSKSWGVF